MIDGTGGYDIVEAENQKRAIAALVPRFESQGIEYTKGFLAAIQGRKPLWLLKFLHAIRCAMGPYCAEAAAHIVLQNHNIDPLLCGREFFRRQ